MAQLTFDQLPNAVSTLLHKVERIEMLLQKLTEGAVPTDEPLSPEEAAELLNIALPTLYAKVRQGEIPYYKPNGSLYFFRDDLIGWVRKRRRKTKAEIQEEARKGVRRG